MSTKLEHLVKHILVAFVVVAALSAAILAALSGTAEAQSSAAAHPAGATPPAAPAAERRAVEPGDSLWSIASERLGPDAAPGRVASEAERIFELNRGLIGDDPGLIRPGRELALPPAVRPPSPQPVAAAERAPAPEERAPAAPLGPREGEAEPAPAARAPSIRPAATTEATVDPAGLAPRERQMLGFGVLLLTVVVAALMAWKLPMRRAVGDPGLVWLPTGALAGRRPAALAPAFASAAPRTAPRTSPRPTSARSTPVRGNAAPEWAGAAPVARPTALPAPRAGGAVIEARPAVPPAAGRRAALVGAGFLLLGSVAVVAWGLIKSD